MTSDREYIDRPDGRFPFMWTVTSRASYDSYEKPVLVEAYCDEASAIRVGRIRHEQGHVVSVTKDIAFTVGK